MLSSPLPWLAVGDITSLPSWVDGRAVERPADPSHLVTSQQGEQGSPGDAWNIRWWGKNTSFEVRRPELGSEKWTHYLNGLEPALLLSWASIFHSAKWEQPDWPAYCIGVIQMIRSSENALRIVNISLWLSIIIIYVYFFASKNSAWFFFKELLFFPKFLTPHYNLYIIYFLPVIAMSDFRGGSV